MSHIAAILTIVLLTVVLAACAPQATPTATLIPPTATPEPPTATPIPPTATPEPPTATAVPPMPTATATATPLPPTATPKPPTVTAVPPTATRVPPTRTPVPPAAPVSTGPVEWVGDMTYERRGGPDSTAWCQAQNIYHNRSDRTLDWPDYQPVIAIANSDGSIRIRYRAGYYSQENGWPNGIKGTPPTIPPGKDSFQWTWYSTTAAAGVYCRYVSVTIGGKTYWAEYTASGKRIDCGPADSCSMLPMATPVAQCPAWYATPAPGKAVLSIENRSTEDIDLIDPVTRAVIGKIPRISNGYGYLVLSLAPGHYEYDLSTSKRIVVDLAPGSSIAAVHPTYRSIGPAILETFAATPPAGCAGNVPPPPPPAAQCPEWYQQPPAGKALLVVENYIPGPVTVVDGAGVVPEFTVDANKADAQWRKVLILNPGKYNFNTRENGFIADMVAGQIYTVALTRDTNKKVATIMVPPPGCQ